MAAAMVVCASASARADAIWLGESARNPIKAGGVKILRVEGSNLEFAGPGGDAVSKPLALVQQMQVDDEPAFSSAEDAYRAGNVVAAVSGYSSSLRNSNKVWVQMRSAMRLTSLSGKSHDLDAAVSAYIFLLQKNPALAVRPTISDADAASLTSVAAQLNTALATAGLSSSVQGALLRLSIEVARSRHDQASLGAALGRLVSLGVATPAEAAEAALAGARASLVAGDFAAAIAAIQQRRTLFTEPAAQLEALDILAAAHDGQAKASNDQAVQEDVAIDYMRVVTFGREVVGQPHVAEALLRVGEIEESLKQPRLAADLYAQLVKDYSSSTAATAARERLQHLAPK